MNQRHMNRYEELTVGIDKRQSRFIFPQRVKTSFDSGLLIPLKWTEVLPGDRFKISLNGVCHMSTPIKPVMDSAWLDVFAFWCPNRVLWEHWENFMGQNDSESNPWIDPTIYSVPQLKFSALNRNPGDLKSYTDILSYLNCPPTVDETEVNALPVRMVSKTWNDFFRNQALQVPINLDTGDSDITYISAPDINGIYNSQNGNFNAWQLSTVTGGACPPVCKFKDYFTTCVPSPQKAEPVYLPLLGLAPVIPGETNTGLYEYLQGAEGNSMRFFLQPNNLTGTIENNLLKYSVSLTPNSPYDSGRSFSLKTDATSSSSNSTDYKAIPSNLYADLSQATSATIEQLNQAIKLQQYYSILAQGGSRYIEILYSLYGVKASDSRLQRVEYLGGKSIPITVEAVAQTSQTGEETPQGNLSAYSITGFDDDFIVNKFFEEHGILMFFGCIRTNQNYAQGINRMWTRKDRFDYYAPVFNNLGFQPVYKTELFANAPKGEVFGYNEAWSEYRQEPSVATGLFNPDSPQPLSSWTYVNDFANAPTLNAQFIVQSRHNIDQTLHYQSGSGVPQFWCDLEFMNTYDRVMGAYSNLSFNLGY